MEGIIRNIRTASGKITISGNLEHLEDLSFRDLVTENYRAFETGYHLSNFTKPSAEQISKQFKVKIT
jgi:hypothetical protein